MCIQDRVLVGPGSWSPTLPCLRSHTDICSAIDASYAFKGSFVLYGKAIAAKVLAGGSTVPRSLVFVNGCSQNPLVAVILCGDIWQSQKPKVCSTQGTNSLADAIAKQSKAKQEFVWFEIGDASQSPFKVNRNLLLLLWMLPVKTE